MDTLSSAAPSKRHSPPKAYFIDELQEVKTISAQQDEELRQLETRLQILEVKHMEKRLSKLAMKHERSIPHGHGEEHRRRRNHHHSYGDSHHREERHHQEAKSKFSFVKVPSFSGDSDPNVYLDWEAKCEQTFKAYGAHEDQKVKIASLEFLDYAMRWWHSIVMDIGYNKKPPVVSWEDLKECMRL